MTEQQIKNFNHRLATEVMGLREGSDSPDPDGLRYYGGPGPENKITYRWGDWQPHKNVEQALQCVERITREDAVPEYSVQIVFEEGMMNVFLEYPNGRTKRFRSIYAALVAALPQPKEEKPEPPKQPEPPKRKGFGISMSCPHCAHSPYIRDPESEVCLNCGKRWGDE